RGAPAIGVAAAMGIAVGVRKSKATGTQKVAAEFYRICELMAATRPTAVNLFWAIDRMKRAFAAAASAGQSVDQIKDVLDREAQAIHDEDVASCRAMGAYGAEVVPAEARILTHCNAGALATTVITDNMAGALMLQGRVNFVVVGADRIAANGDTANKIGTYGVAVLAREHDIPFYVAAPRSTIDLNTPDGSRIPIEERSAKEVTHVGGAQLAPEGAAVGNSLERHRIPGPDPSRMGRRRPRARVAPAYSGHLRRRGARARRCRRAVSGSRCHRRDARTRPGRIAARWRLVRQGRGRRSRV